jgi:hypothetical protein
MGTKCSFHLVPHFEELLVTSNSCHSDTPSFGGPNIFSPLEFFWDKSCFFLKCNLD